MKQSTRIWAFLLTLATLAGCGSSGTQVEFSNNKRVAKYQVAIYKTAENQEWVASLAKAEKVTIINQPDLKSGILYVGVAGGKKGYVSAKSLAYDAVVLVKDSTLFQRPIITSGKAPRAEFCTTGQILFVDDQSNEGGQKWIKVTGVNQGNYFDGWILLAGENIKKSDAVLLAAVQWEQLLPLLNQPTLSEAAIKMLESLKTAPVPFSEWAVQTLGKYAAPLEQVHVTTPNETPVGD